jgi:type IV pilus assembly protein PilY1
MKDGVVLKSFTRADDAKMEYSLPATAAIVDWDNDGFIDTAYMGDLGGNVWRFKLCTKADGSGCSESSWQATLLYDSSSGVIRPIYTMPAAAVDGAGNFWIYWGTGDKSDPTAPNQQEKLYSLKDNDRTTTYSISDMDNITSSGATYDNATSTKAGYYINVAGEKILADPVVFGGVVYFTTYSDPANQPCEQTGLAKLYGVRYTSGGGVFPGGRSMDIGQGIPSSPVVSTGQGATTSDIYITTSSGGVGRVPFSPPGGGRRTQMLYWRDQRLQ